MNNFVLYEKCSKREKKARDAIRRGSWNGVNPVSRVVPSKKLYKRNPKHKGRNCSGAWDSPLFRFLFHSFKKSAILLHSSSWRKSRNAKAHCQVAAV